MTGIVIVLIVLIVIKAVLIIRVNNKNTAWYFHLSYNFNKHVLQMISEILYITS